MNKWIQHVKEYQKKHNCSYKDALKGAKMTYNKKGGSLYDDDWEDDKKMRIEPFNPYKISRIPQDPWDIGVHHNFSGSYEIPLPDEEPTTLDKIKSNVNRTSNQIGKSVNKIVKQINQTKKPNLQMIKPSPQLARQINKLWKGKNPK